MKKGIIKINESTYTLSFGISGLRLLGRMWGFNTINEVTEKLAMFDKMDVNNISLDFLDLIEDVFKAGILNEPENKASEKDLTGLIDYIFANPELITTMIAELSESMQVQKKESGKSKPTMKKASGMKK